jgi:ABC-2 type transport system ATP-binding protein
VVGIPGTRDHCCMSDVAIRVAGLCKTYQGRAAVDGLDLTVERGEVFSLLGPNGAGKSTTVEILEGYRSRDGGDVAVLGHDPARATAEWKSRIGIVLQRVDDLAQSSELTVREWVGSVAAYFPDPMRPDEAIELVGLAEKRDARSSSLSGGQRRRLDVALGLVHRPGLLFLDEPSTGLDPQSRANLWEHVLRLRAERGMTVFLTTHYLDQADTMAERVMVMDHGRVIADDTADRLKSKHAGERIVVRAATRAGAARLAAAVATEASDVAVDGTTMTARVEDGPATLPALLRAVPDVAVETAEVRRATLDDVFLALTGRSLRESVTSADEHKGA